MTAPTTTPTFPLILTCADGLENALLIELQSLDLQGKIIRTGRVSLDCALQDLYQICLKSRVASRVLLPLGDYFFKKKQDDNGKSTIADDIPQVLYDFAKRIDWAKHFTPDNTFVVRTSIDKRVAVNQQFTTLRIKDAIADRFNEAFGERPSVNSDSPEFVIHAHIGTDLAEIALDLAGQSLHRRGYRTASTEAPLKENLAAALLYECGWHTGDFDTLIDPMCGSGTFAIESLLMRLDYPVGAENTFAFTHFRHHDEILWQETRQSALDNFYANLDKPLPTIYAFDADPVAINATHKNIHSSALKFLSDKLPKVLILKNQSLNKLPKTLKELPNTAKPLIITNPPYGERLGDENLIKPLYQGLGLILKEHLNKAYIGILASQIEQADTLPIKNPNTLKCHNGALNVYFRYGELNAGKSLSLIEQFEKIELNFDEIFDNKQFAELKDGFLTQTQEFANRLQKNLKDLKSKAKKEQVSNLRIYDADLPNFNLAVDIYGNFVHIQEYAPPKQIDETTAKTRFNLALAVIRQVLNINREQIFIKTRKKQSGNEQYIKQGNKGKHYSIKEPSSNDNTAYFLVNFTDYLDTGLFIDHRTMRTIIGEKSKNKAVLNLFAYTCSASVHSAINGAKSVTSVDLSGNYLNWGKQNFALNGLMVDNYEFISADVFEWIKGATDKYDMIFIDPPTFSNSKKFKGTFDIQRDHAPLINRAMNRLTANGVLYFSNNFSKFELSDELKNRYDITEITHKTTGFDFKKGIHQSYEIRHKNASKFVIDDSDFDDVDFNAFDDKSFNAKDNKGFKEKGNFKDNRTNKKDQSSFKKDTQKSSDKKFNKKGFDKKSFNKKPFDKKPYQTDKKAPIAKPKRLYVNPKLANKDEIEQRLKQALDKENLK